jgi:hypothetical protein
VVEQIATPRNTVDNEFLGVTICSTTLSAMRYLYIIILHVNFLSSHWLVYHMAEGGNLVDHPLVQSLTWFL